MAKVFKLAEVEKHKNGKGDGKSVWFVLHDKVYDVTKFLDEVSDNIIRNATKYSEMTFLTTATE
jgi:cytochrome b involved in lipid metabolism